MVKKFGGKKVWRKGCFARIGEKTLANVDFSASPITNQRLTVKRSNSKL